MEKLKPAEKLEITNLEMLKVAADPLRNQIMEVLTPKPLAVNQIAEKLGLAPSKLYYHVNLLEKHGFIHIVDTVVHGNIIEKFYSITAYNLELNKDLFSFDIMKTEGKENLISIFTNTLDITKEDIIRSMEARHHNLGIGVDEPLARPVLDARYTIQISDEKAREFHEKFRSLIKEFEAEDDPEGDENQTYALTLLYYPSFYYKESNEENGKD